jgi:hypothetical protein
MGVVLCSPSAAPCAMTKLLDTVVAIAARPTANFTITDAIFTVFVVLFIVISSSRVAR